ncbi:MAG: D-alanyl-D-alanine carboxypeptidase/D-alanyl-D-alanine endopeptidase [Chitinophagaceae bacterium]
MFKIQNLTRLIFLCGGSLLLISGIGAQTVGQKLQKAYTAFENDSQMAHAMSSLFVIDAKTGQVVFDRNSRIGLAPASTQKIITSVTAFELLGKDYRYATEFGYSGSGDSVSMYIRPSGDPTLGSWRWNTTHEQAIMKNLKTEMAGLGKRFNQTIEINQAGWETGRIPDGWIWQDIANYYGAGAGALNWRENQFNLVMKSGSRVGDGVEIVKTDPPLFNHALRSEAKAEKAGSGDNAYIYFPVSGKQGIVRGTIPVNETDFTISGAMPDPPAQFTEKLRKLLPAEISNSISLITLDQEPEKKPAVFYTHYSPTLDSIIYWFNKRSINLYGEALLKTMAFAKKGVGSTPVGVALVRDFWKGKGVDDDELNLYDGSGLSPLNRVTTHAQTEILRYARGRDWFPEFLRSLPEYNGMTMKSGTISDVKGFCGYHKARDGKEYIFSFLVNNYSGKTSSLVAKMYSILNELK